MKERIRKLFIQGKTIKYICACLSTTEHEVSKVIDEVFLEFNSVRPDKFSEIRKIEEDLMEAIINEKHNRSQANIHRTNQLSEMYVKYPNSITLN